MATCNLIAEIISEAKIIFARDPKTFKSLRTETEISEGIRSLSNLIKTITKIDLGLDKSSKIRNSTRVENNNQRSRHMRKPAPVTYQHIFENQDVSVGIFMVHPNQRIPLHNHPKMSGILKVITGKVDIVAYSSNSKSERIPEELARDAESSNLIRRGIIFPAVREFSRSINANTGQVDPLVLRPNFCDIHEIVNTGDETAAFFDVLSPPYNEEEEGGEELADRRPNCDEIRDCNYFVEVHSGRPGSLNAQPERPGTMSDSSRPGTIDEKPISWLMYTESPRDFFCDSEEYKGLPPVV